MWKQNTWKSYSDFKAQYIMHIPNAFSRFFFSIVCFSKLHHKYWYWIKIKLEFWEIEFSPAFSKTRLSSYAWNWVFLSEVPFLRESVVIYSYILGNDHNFVFFGYKVTIQQHFESHLLWRLWKTKTKYQEAENLRICAKVINSGEFNL